MATAYPKRYLYVKSGGTCTTNSGINTSPLSGSWSSALPSTSSYYNNLYAAALVIHGYLNTDEYDWWVLVSSSHYESNPTYLNSTRAYSTRAIVVDDLAIENGDSPVEWASNQLSVVTGKNKNIKGNFYTPLFRSFYGMYFDSQYIYIRRQDLANTPLGIVEFVDCVFSYTTSDNGVTFSSDPYWIMVRFVNCIIDLGYVGYFTSSNNAFPTAWEFIGCKIQGSSSATDHCCFVNARFIGCDFSDLPRSILENASGYFEKCIFPSTGYGAMSYQLSACTQSFDIFLPPTFIDCVSASSSVSARVNREISFVSDTSVYLSSGAVDQYGNNFSYKLVTPSENSTPYADINLFKSPRLKLCEIVCDTSSTKTFTIEIAQPSGSTVFKANELYIEAMYPDDTSYKGNFITTRESLSFSATGTTLPTSSATWTGITSPVKQYLTLTTTTTGREGLVSFWVYVYRPGSTVYIDPEVTVT
jgi:hypothetical protein